MVKLILETSGPGILTIVAWICAIGWILFAGMILSGLIKRKPLTSGPDSHLLGDAPLVSLLIPARNEAHRILAQSVRSVLAQDYEQIEVIAVNDRSTDDTESILRSIAEMNARLRVINSGEPPPGWLGKPFALQQAFEASRGQWILTIDADMLLESGAVRTSLEHALAGGYDVLTLMPYFEAKSFWERAFTPAWLLALLGSYPFAILNNPKIKHAFAFGGFSLIRRESLERIGGFAAVRAEIVEDVRLAQLLKGSGARYRIEHAPNLIRTRMQRSLREIWDFLSRGMLSVVRYSIIPAVITAMIGYAFVIAPVIVAVICLLMVIAAGPGEWPSLLFPCLVIWGTQIFTLLFICRKFEIPLVYAFTTPLGLSLFYSALLISTINIMRGRGVAWKGRKIYGRGGVRLPIGRREAGGSAADE